MLNVSIMASLRNLPLVAEYGLSIIFFFAVVALFFLVPCALVSAELATGWPKSGGIYIWIREALGDRWGFFGIWMQWVHNVAWYPVILSFVAATFAYIVSPSLAHNKVYVLSVILGCFWGMTLLNYLGIRTSSLFSTLGVILGTIAPGIFIIGLGLTWLMGDQPAQIKFNAESLIPDLSSLGNLVFLAGLFLAFAGLEVTAAFAGEVEKPQKNYPRAILLSAIITFALFLLGSLAIATVIPKEQISLVAGLMDAFKVFFESYKLGWILPGIGALLILGAIAEVNSWIVGPVKGLHATSIHGNLPPFFQNQNSHGTPTHLLLFQAIIVSITSCAFLFMPSLSSSYWLLSALSAQSYLVMYVLMFIAAIRLRYSKPHVPRVYEIPWKTKGMWFFASIGILASLFAIFLAFVPPSQLDVGSLFFYEGFLIVGLLVMIAIPLIIYQFRKPHWVRKG
ncbi:MAG: amino acid permease [Chlamydiales bacterium]|nr:amino acid permease [Chlamydiales bacterium]